MRRELTAMVTVAGLWACGGQTLGIPSGGDGGSSSSSGGSSGGSSSGSSGGSSSSSGGADAGRVPTNHRPNDSECTAPAAPGNCPGGGGLQGACDADPQCTSGSDGRCIQPSSGIAQGCQCTYDACADDAACPTGQTCACHGLPYTESEGNACVTGNCRVDADCGVGGYCSPSSLMAILRRQSRGVLLPHAPGPVHRRRRLLHGTGPGHLRVLDGDEPLAVHHRGVLRVAAPWARGCRAPPSTCDADATAPSEQSRPVLGHCVVPGIRDAEVRMHCRT